MKVVTFKLRDEEVEELDRMAARLGVTRSDLIRKAVRALLSGELGTISRSGYIIKVRRVVLT